MGFAILLIALVGVALWLYLGAPLPKWPALDALLKKGNKPEPVVLGWLPPGLSEQAKHLLEEQAVILTWAILRSYAKSPEVQARIDELLPLLLKKQDANA